MTTKTWSLFWGSNFVRAPLQNGVGRYVQQLQRITFKFCKTHGGSKGMREYIEKELIGFARENPGVVVYVKPRRHRSPCLKAEYLNGGEDYISTHVNTCEDIVKWVEYLRGRSGYPIERLRKYHHTDYPSIQGPWTPWTHRHPSINFKEYPCEELSAVHPTEISATQKLLELYEQQKQQQEGVESTTS
ncbi:39S ribosomal protein L43, mitochondrial-like [Portunus trituberculatus]|uniref:39S ribosomal protein L43, mitochondrial-like n=1 Tax=Portunus trituberculatus TaxID=210409 RepID=UPI001E1CF52C|nr:39S ribosomal protein L43, mitochondrial-like [Portunus trituberculatus]